MLGTPLQPEGVGVVESNRRFPTWLVQLANAWLVLVLLFAGLSKLAFGAAAFRLWTQPVLTQWPANDVNVVIGAFEVACVFWLITGVHIRKLWVVLSFFFLGVTLYSIYQVLQGEYSCNCFGPKPASRFLSLGLSASCLFDLAFLRFGVPREAVIFRRNSVQVPDLVCLSYCAAFLAVVAPVGGPLAAYLRYESATATPTRLTIPLDIFSGEPAHAAVTITNNSPLNDLQIVGIESSSGLLICYCDALPKQIPPQTTARLDLHVKVARWDYEQILALVKSCEQDPAANPFITDIIKPISFLSSPWAQKCCAVELQVCPTDECSRLFQAIRLQGVLAE